MKKGFFNISVCLIFWGLLSLSTQGQTHKYFIIKGILFSEATSIDSCSIQISKKSANKVVAPVGQNGRFRLELEYNSEYELSFNQKGLQAKTIIVNTDIPKNLPIETTNFPNFLMAVKLCSELQNAENIDSENQIQYISYFPNTNSFRKVPTMLEDDFVEKPSNLQTSLTLQSAKTKTLNFQVF